MKKLSKPMAEALCAMRNTNRSVVSIREFGRTGTSEPAYAERTRITNRTLEALQKRGLVRVVATHRGSETRRWARHVWLERRRELTDEGKTIACKVPK